MYAIGVDSGTQGTKVLIVDFEGKILSSGRAAHRFVDNLKPGESEQDPQVWIEALKKALEEAMKNTDIRASEIVCMGVSGQQHGFIPLDETGLPIRPAKLWNDTSTVEEVESLIECLGGKQSFIQKMGINLAVGYTASKILWLRRHEPENYEKLATVLLPHNYINYVLTGKAHMEFGDASGTGLMDIKKRSWNQESISAIDPERSTTKEISRSTCIATADLAGSKLGPSTPSKNKGAAPEAESAVRLPRTRIALTAPL